MIIEPSEFDPEKHCTRHGWLTRLDGKVDMTLHDWGTWGRGAEPGTRQRQCVICGITQVRSTRDKRWQGPAKPQQRRGNTEKIVNLEDYRAS